jgi:hypothetical protein
MSLKTDFYDGVTGITQKTQAAFDAGEALVGTIPGEGQYTAIQSGLQSNAALGNTKFTVTVTVTYNPAALRGNKGDNLILKAFLAGVSSGLGASGIFNYECTPTLNTTDTVNTYIDLNFTF